jgi:nitrite reductase (cytochrome c-552)
MLKVQHPEFEMIYGATPSAMGRSNYGCNDCHMGQATNSEGKAYSMHYWRSPLEIEGLVEDNCSACHDDFAAEVQKKHDDYYERVQAVSFELEAMVKEFVVQVEAGTLTGDNLTNMQQIHRSAQWYWDWVMVENSSGAHNFSLSMAELDTCEKFIAEGNALLGR